MKKHLFLFFCMFNFSMLFSQISSTIIDFETAVLNGSSAYYVMRTDKSIWYAASGDAWKMSATTGLPEQKVLKFNVAVIDGSAAYYVMMADQSLWYAASGAAFKKSATAGLPQ